MDDREFSSEQEYFDGVRADGGKPVFQSRKLYKGATKSFSEEPAEFPFENRDPRTVTADEMRYMVKLQELDDLDKAASTARELIDLGLAAARRLGTACPGPAEGLPSQATGADSPQRTASTPVQESPSSADSAVNAALQDSPDPCAAEDHLETDETEAAAAGFTPDLRARKAGVRTVRGSSVVVPDDRPESEESLSQAEKAAQILDRLNKTELEQHTRKRAASTRPAHTELKPEAGLVLAERGSRLLLAVTPKRTALAMELISMAMDLETKQAFMEDRAVAVVHGLLLHLDEHFRELGFGAWMPFRWPDQWLSFCGVLRRVLAANGLIHSEHADIYRRLLDETPPVELEGTVQDRVKESKVPLNPAQCKSNQGASTMSELKKRLKAEVWDPAETKQQAYDEYWKSAAKPPP